VIYALFFLTGAAGLVYEMSWSRQIGIFFGHTVNAAAVLLGVYFAGMALGYWLAGRLARASRSPLAGYALAELLVCAWACATPQILKLFALPSLAALLNSETAGLQTLARVVAAFLLLLPATFALGATLPFVAEHLSRRAPAQAAARSTLAYALNTAGAVCGVLAATFSLILTLGVTGSSYFAAGISGLCGLLALQLAARASYPRPAAAGQSDPGEPGTLAAAKPPAGLSGPEQVWLAGLSGFGTLAMQVLYTRMFALVFHNSTYTFGGIVAVFLLALALGSWLAGRLAQRYPLRRLVQLSLLLGAAAIVLSAGLLQLLTGGLRYFEAGQGFAGYIAGSLGLIVAVVLLPVLLLGLQLPLVWHAALAAQREGSGAVLGRLTSVNTLCATAGALLSSFLLLPLLGLWQSVGLLAALYVTAALLCMNLRPPLRFVLLAASLALAPGIAGWLLDPRLEERAARRGQSVVFSRDTPYGRIDVLRERESGELAMRQNSHYTLGGTRGGQSEVRQGLLPLLLHPGADAGSLRVCYLGLATGITAGAALDDPQVGEITAVELIPEVAEAASLFSAATNGITASPRARIVVNDARYHLYATAQQYDVIVSDLFVPWHSQTGYLYTVEHYRAARERLAAGGLFCQWLPLYQLGPRELEMIADSFAQVFPVVTVWRGDESGESPILGLVGSESPLRLERRELNQHIAQLDPPFGGYDPQLASPETLAQFYLGDWPLRPGARLNTDEHPRVEFLAPLSQRAGDLLSGERLQRYEDEVLKRLARGGFAISGLELR